MSLKNILLVLLLFCTCSLVAQEDSVVVKKDSLSFNQKMENLFKVIPVPLFSYSSEAGHTFGLAKFNLFDMKKSDTISKPSKISEVVTFSTKGRINISVSTELVFKQNKYVILSYINYKKQPEYIFGIGNNVSKAGVEQVEYDRIKFFTTALRLVKKNFYVGIPLDIAGYFNIQPEDSSFLTTPHRVPGVDGGFTIGTGLAAAFDSRDNRYNPYKGAYILAVLVAHPEWLGSEYQFTKFELDARKYFNPWKKHVIALQATTSSATGNTPFYELSQLGGDKQMRGYYQGAYRDKVLVDGQLEYRMPVWNIFGLVGWIGTGRVASGYDALSFDGWKLSYGTGLRIRVDSKHNTNLRLDFGFGPHGINGTYINFAEAF